jgi:hypothetical protein
MPEHARENNRPSTMASNTLLYRSEDLLKLEQLLRGDATRRHSHGEPGSELRPTVNRHLQRYLLVMSRRKWSLPGIGSLLVDWHKQLYTDELMQMLLAAADETQQMMLVAKHTFN